MVIGSDSRSANWKTTRPVSGSRSWPSMEMVPFVHGLASDDSGPITNPAAVFITLPEGLVGAFGKLRARFEILYLTGWSPHDSQQKPLAPGAAKSRLADALGATETVISGSRTSS